MKGCWIGALVATATLLTGCMHMAPATKAPDAYQLTREETELLRARLNGANRPRVSLAMSGGGIRSSLYNFGVLKALYDDGILDRVDIVSSVSGGSYLSYWLFTEQSRHPEARFGQPLFGKEVFAETLCKLTARANFVTWAQMAGYGSLSAIRPSANRSLYEKRLAYTFGDADSKSSVAMADLRPMIEKHGQPYLITNATTYGVHLNDTPWPGRAFEFTPLHHGTLESHVPWGMNNRPAEQATVAYATLASGAANRVLKRQFDAPFPHQWAGSVLLWDGGKSDNLGAVAPLMRGTRNLIVVDGQFDGKNEKFGAYYTLQGRMGNFGDAVTIDRNPDVKLGIYDGRGVGKMLDTNLQYIKMERPAALMAELEAMKKPSTPQAEERRTKALSAHDAYAAARGDYVAGEWQCGALPATHTLEPEDLMRFVVADYMDWVEYPTAIRQAIRKDYPVIGSGVRHDFPETTTFDQSFYMNQALAYVGLGYLSTRGKVQLKE